MNDKYTTINKAGEFRIFLHRLLLLERTECMEILKTYINAQFETLTTEYTEWQTFQFKIKKSNLKKKQNFTHTVDFYYGYIDDAIYAFLTNPTVQLTINELLPSLTNSQNVKDAFDEIRSKSLSCRYLYTITTAQDNIVVINI